MKLGLTISALSVVLMVAISTLRAQCRLPQTKAWIAVSNAVGNQDTLWFGFDSTATCGEDPALCEWYPAEPCGAPSNFFCIFWTDPCNGGPGAIVLWKYDFRRYLHPARIDTHTIDYQPGPSGYPLTFRWSRMLISAICDSAALRYWSGAYVRYRLDLVDSLVLTGPVYELQLFRYGQRLNPVQIQETGSCRPRSFSLFQNYPNPFNPSTRISFSIPHSSFVTLKVCDLLGREVATLVNEQLVPGDYERSFNAEGLAGGVYFYRLSVVPTNKRDGPDGGFVQTKKLLLLR